MMGGRCHVPRVIHWCCAGNETLPPKLIEEGPLSLGLIDVMDMALEDAAGHPITISLWLKSKNWNIRWIVIYLSIGNLRILGQFSEFLKDILWICEDFLGQFWGFFQNSSEIQIIEKAKTEIFRRFLKNFEDFDIFETNFISFSEHLTFIWRFSVARFWGFLSRLKILWDSFLGLFIEFFEGF